MSQADGWQLMIGPDCGRWRAAESPALGGSNWSLNNLNETRPLSPLPGYCSQTRFRFLGARFTL